MQTVFLSGSVVTIILSLFLLYNHRDNIRTVLFLSITMVCASILGLTHTLARGAGPAWLLALLFNVVAPLYFLIGPFLYLHVRSVLTDHFAIRRKDLWHFLPAFLVLINISPYLLLPFAEKLEVARNLQQDLNYILSLDINLLIRYRVVTLVRPFFILVYAVAAGYLLFNFYARRTAASQSLLPFPQVKFTFYWLLFFSGALFLLSLGNLMVGYLFMYQSQQWFINLFILLQAMVVFAIPASLLFFPQVLYGIPMSTNVSSEIKTIPNEKKKEPDTQKYFDDLALEVRAVMEREKPYLQTDFSLDDLAFLMKVPKHHLYYCFNEVMKVKFVDLRTELRVTHAKELLAGINELNITIEAVGTASGFPSRSSFYRSFKETTGMTPMDFVKVRLQPS
jgi:AraC-like DNA-binding protein